MSANALQCPVNCCLAADGMDLDTVVFSVFNEFDIDSFQRNPVVSLVWRMEELPHVTTLLRVFTFR